MTFAELREFVRREIVVDDYEDAFENADLDDVLWKASYEVAAALDIPRAITTSSVAADALTVTAPANCARVHSLSIGGDDGLQMSVQQIYRMRPGSSRPLRYFNFDPRRADAILIAPPSVGGTAVIEYTLTLTRPSPFDTCEPWGGVLPQFHPMIAYRAAISLFQMDERENEVQHWQNEYQLRLAEVSHFLGGTSTPAYLLSLPQGGSQ